MKIRPVGAELFHVDGRRDVHDEADSPFPNSAHAPKIAGYNSWKCLRIKQDRQQAMHV
jgi:hypothetical protein